MPVARETIILMFPPTRGLGALSDDAHDVLAPPCSAISKEARSKRSSDSVPVSGPCTTSPGVDKAVPP